MTPRQEQQARELVERAPRPQLTAADEGATHVVPPELGELLLRILKIVAEGGTVTVASLPSELTTTVAAEQLGVSRPTLMRMIRDGEIPAHKVGSHHRLKLTDVQESRRVRLERQRAAFEDLRRLEAELNLE
ncbi:helix-turn-helix domain-containing protein [Jiangella rhizosphaerae]|uniref:helix-turn-helix domain-containing protein n=1 Tax=Jiangella rhizosphaerae TaxID=2293569 RepID=UPI0018F39E80|nr:helix-turn-helix domain-containing protein [Jiangella rhizosphaerae]